MLFFFKSSLEDMLIDFRERGREGGREGEKHAWVASPMCPDQGPLIYHPTNWGLKQQPRYVPWLGIKPMTLLVYRMMLQPTEPRLPRLYTMFFKQYPMEPKYSRDLMFTIIFKRHKNPATSLPGIEEKVVRRSSTRHVQEYS